MKNKRKLLKTTVYVLLSLLLLTAGILVYGGSLDVFEKEYASYNAKGNGVKALYLLTQQTGFEVSRFSRPSRFLPERATMVVVKPETERFTGSMERRYLKEWLRRGNTLLMAIDEEEMDDYELYEFLTPNQEFGLHESGKAAGVGSGKIIILEDAQGLTNLGLQNGNGGLDFIKALDDAGNSVVLFNEYYHGFGQEGFTFWDIAGPTARLVLVQVFLGMVLYLWIRSRRFGQPETVLSIEKREENEALFALANIYMKARAYSMVLDTYMTGFRKELARYLGFYGIPEEQELLRAVEANGYVKSLGARELLQDCNSYARHSEKKARRLSALIARAEQIRKGIR
jgi:hypothetical protein